MYVVIPSLLQYKVKTTSNTPLNNDVQNCKYNAGWLVLWTWQEKLIDYA